MSDFIKNLEIKLVNSEATFQEFDKGLWFYLCSKSKSELKSLTKELGAKGKYLCDYNIGNIRLEVLSNLQINFML